MSNYLKLVAFAKLHILKCVISNISYNDYYVEITEYC